MEKHGFLSKQYADRIRRVKAFEMLKLLIDEFGFSNQCTLFPLEDMIKEGFSLGDYEIERGKMELFRPFLDVDAHRQVFMWAEELVFFRKPQKYSKFLAEILMDKDNLIWFPEADAREIALELLDHMETDTGVQNQLRRIYLTAEEYEAYQNKLSLIQKRKALKERMEHLRILKRNFTKLVAKSKGKKEHIEKLQHYISRCSYMDRDEAYKIVAAYLNSAYSEQTMPIFSEQNLRRILELLSDICWNQAAGLDMVKKVVNHMEVAEDEEKNIVAFENM